MGDKATIIDNKLTIHSSSTSLDLYTKSSACSIYSEGLGLLSEDYGYSAIRSVDITHEGDRFMGVLSVGGVLNKQSGHTILIVPYETAVKVNGEVDVVKGVFDKKTSSYQPPGHIKAMELIVNQEDGFLWIDHISSEALVYLRVMIQNLSKQPKKEIPLIKTKTFEPTI